MPWLKCSRAVPLVHPLLQPIAGLDLRPRRTVGDPTPRVAVSDRWSCCHPFGGATDLEEETDEWIIVDLPRCGWASNFGPPYALQCMGYWGYLLSLVYVVSVFFAAEFWDVAIEQSERQLLPDHEFEMPPTQWERRYVQTSQSHGQEVMLLRRSNEAGYWLAATATEGICKVPMNDRRVMRTTQQGPRNGVAYSSCAVLSQAQRDNLSTQAEALALAGTAGVRIIGGVGGATLTMKRYAAVVMSAPMTCWKVARWAMRKPVRAVGALAMAWILMEALRGMGVYDKVHNWSTMLYQFGVQWKEMVVEASTTAAETWEMLSGSYLILCEYIHPAKALLGTIALYYVGKLHKEMVESETPLSTPGPSGGPSPCDTPPNAQLVAMEAVGQSMDVQRKLMEQVAERLEKIEVQRKDDQDEAKEKEWVRKAREESAKEQEEKVQRRSWDELRKRMSHFEQVLQEDRSKAAGGPVDETPAKEKTAGIPPMEETQIHEKETPEKPTESKDAEMKVLLRRLQKKTKTPQEIFVQALEEYVEEDKEIWAANFPPGYRERIAPQFLGELYAKGKEAKQWAKEWVNLKGLGECPEAREIIPACSAIDAIFLTDQAPGAINLVSTEKQARKIMGIQSGFKDVNSEKDWKHQSSKGWKSKVDKEIWKRIDPSIDDLEHVFINRKAENEMRLEMDRDVLLMKAKSKLENAK